MTIRNLILAAILALVTSTASTSAFASDEADASNTGLYSEDLNVEEFDAENLTSRDHRRDWDRPNRGNRGSFVCYARNITGRTFAAWGNRRTPARWVQQRAMQECRNRSGFLRFSCRYSGCRR